MKESDFQSILKEEFEMLRATVLNKMGTLFEGKGWPDLYVAHRMWTGWLELKVKATVSTEQKQRIAHLRDNLVDARVLRFVKTPEGWVEQYSTDGNEAAVTVFRPEHNDYSKADGRRCIERFSFLANTALRRQTSSLAKERAGFGY